jgi:hypothetical protein
MFASTSALRATVPHELPEQDVEHKDKLSHFVQGVTQVQPTEIFKKGGPASLPYPALPPPPPPPPPPKAPLSALQASTSTRVDRT